MPAELLANMTFHTLALRFVWLWLRLTVVYFLISKCDDLKHTVLGRWTPGRQEGY